MTHASTTAGPESIVVEWRPIVGYEGLYEVSNYGQVRRVLSALKPGYKRGYAHVSLCKGGKQSTHYITRLVAKAFIPNPHEKEQVNHINGNPGDDRAENLEWSTPKENTQHAIRNGLRTVSPTVRGPYLAEQKLLPPTA